MSHSIGHSTQLGSRRAILQPVSTMESSFLVDLEFVRRSSDQIRANICHYIFLSSDYQMVNRTHCLYMERAPSWLGKRYVVSDPGPE